MQSNHKPVKQRKLSTAERQAFDDLRWADTAQEVQQHPGKLVVIRRKRVIAVGRDQIKLLRQAARKENCAEEDFVVVAVPTADLEELPH